jgi:hypothetical protein
MMKILNLEKKTAARVLSLLLALLLMATALTGCLAVSMIEPPEGEKIDGGQDGSEPTDADATGEKNESTDTNETTEQLPEVEMPSEELIIRIKNDFFDYIFQDDPKIENYDRGNYVYEERYYGIYNGCVIAKIYASPYGALDRVWTQEVGGVAFHHPDSNWMVAWKDGEIMDLGGAYAAGWLTVEELEVAAILYHGIN